MARPIRSGGSKLPSSSEQGPGKQSGRGPRTQGQSEQFRVNYLIHDVSRLRRLLFDQEMRPYGITHAQWTTLAQLSRSATGSMTQADLARLLGIGKVAVSKLIDRLEKTGLVKRVYDPNDRRVNLICSTPEAEVILSKMTDVSRLLNHQLLEGIDQKHISTMEKVLAAIKRNARVLLHPSTNDVDER